MKNQDKSKAELNKENKVLLGKINELEKIIDKNIRTEEALRESEERYKRIYNSSTDAIMILGPPTWKFISGNSTYMKMFGIKSLEEFKNYRPWDISPKKQPDGKLSSVKAKEMIHIAVNKGSNFFEWRHKNLKGKEFTATVLLTKVERCDKMFLQATVKNISREKEAEEKLKESEERFEAFMNYIPAGIFIKDVNGQYLFSNDFNINYHDVVNWKGKTVYDFFPKEVADRFTKDDKKLLNGGNLLIEDSIIDKNGKEFYYKNYQFGIKQANGKILIGGISFDVTKEKQTINELKESEEKFRILAKTVPIAIMLYQNDKWIYVNRRAEEICGYKFSELKNLYFWEFIAPEHQEIIKMRGKAREKGINATTNYEFKIITKSGKEKWVLLNGNKIKFGSKYAGLITVLDVTERKKIEDNLKDKMNKLEKWNKLTIGRELKMIELKKEINELLEKAELSEKYKVKNNTKE